MADEDEYDLEAVEAQLARMRQRRNNHLIRAAQPPIRVSPSSLAPQGHQKDIPEAISEFELNEADLSHGSDSEDDDSDCDSKSTNFLSSDDETRDSRLANPNQSRIKAAKRSKARLRDSLDLSMSIAELSEPPKARVNPRKSVKAVNASPSGHKADQAQKQQHDTPTTSIPQAGQGSLNKTACGGRGAGNGDVDGDAWTSNLVRRRRRQLEKDAALAKDPIGNCTTTSAATQLVNQACVQEVHTCGTPPKTSNSVSSPQDSRREPSGNSMNQRATTDRALEISGSDHSKKVLSPSKRLVLASQMIQQERRPERRESPPPVPARALQPSEKSAAPTKSHDETKPSRLSTPVAYSYLKAPQQYSTKAPLVLAPASASNNVATTRAYSPNRVELTAKARVPTAVPVKSQSTEVRVTVDCFSKSSSKSTVDHHVHFACPEEEEDDELLSAEEEKLRQSLEKLDNRLTKLNNDTKPQQQQLYKRDKSVPQDPRTTGMQSSSSKAPRRALITESRREDVEVADFVDDSVVAAAAYGGGAHCKSGQMTSALERSCCTRRAEMSSGLHKLRVRTGGAMVQESNNSSANLDKDGKHKVVVKKDLAHLLF